MAVTLVPCQGKRMSKDDKAERLAAQLRENLRKRKAQARAVGATDVVPAEAGTPDQKETDA
jgi:hypothetical protein